MTLAPQDLSALTVRQGNYFAAGVALERDLSTYGFSRAIRSAEETLARPGISRQDDSGASPSTEDRRKDPLKYSRLGVPNGMRKAEAMALRHTAGEIADSIVRALEADGVLPEAVIPDSDDAVAKACIRELAVIAFGPGKDQRTKLMALYALLKYTKGRPTRRLDYALTAEEWLRKATEECRSDLPPPALRQPIPTK
jgi:hypothetical protein